MAITWAALSWDNLQWPSCNGWFNAQEISKVFFFVGIIASTRLSKPHWNQWKIPWKTVEFTPMTRANDGLLPRLHYCPFPSAYVRRSGGNAVQLVVPSALFGRGALQVDVCVQVCFMCFLGWVGGVVVHVNYISQVISYFITRIIQKSLVFPTYYFFMLSVESMSFPRIS